MCTTVQGLRAIQRVIRVAPSSLFYEAGEGKRIELPYLSKETDPEMWVHWGLIWGPVFYPRSSIKPAAILIVIITEH